MRVSELRSAIESIRQLFSVSDASKQEQDLGRLSDLLSSEAERDLDDYLSEVKRKLAPPATVELHLARLRDAGFDEARFKAAIATLRTDRMISKESLVKLAKDFGVIRLSTKSKATIIDSIERYFYWTLNERDANALAKRATPW